MSDPLTVAAHEQGVTRVFAIDVPAPEIERLRNGGASAIASLFGLETIDMAHVELFPLSDLGPLGLSDYLIAGSGIPSEQVLADRDQLDAITGHVLILHSRAMGGDEVELAPRSPLRWVGTYALPTVSVPMTPLRSDGAQGHLSPGGSNSAATSGLNRGAILTVLALVVIVVLVVAFVV